MKASIKLLLASLLALAFLVPAASARPRVVIHGGYYGPAFYGGWGWGPGWWGPGWYGPYEPYYVVGSRDTGSVKIETKAKNAMVYVDGGYAGTVGSLKTFPLKTGEHDLALRDPSGHTYYQEHVNVLPDKTLKLYPDAR